MTKVNRLLNALGEDNSAKAHALAKRFINDGYADELDEAVAKIAMDFCDEHKMDSAEVQQHFAGELTDLVSNAFKDEHKIRLAIESALDQDDMENGEEDDEG